MDQVLPSTYYHIFNHAIGDKDLFSKPVNYRYFLQQYHQHIDAIADTYVYCQMPNPPPDRGVGFASLGPDKNGRCNINTPAWFQKHVRRSSI